ncbi:hypothetical protein T458_24040 [Brevibacillus panacihumi W25]|uniref:Peptidase M48 domain-containing protein n=1 Tax=Brevibacillus panacihumi W25 TaxID=1408254 RepID=V6M0L4_9BACL|nr:M48 family metallopeptidase [Brevibacillus panacihumi]EST52154.1 hypothetical protein T458_24040 [Brevibacillus panacihumi W25]
MVVTSESVLSVQKQYCPECGEEIVAVKGYIPWCQACNWNLHPPHKDKNPTLFERYYLKIGNFAGEKLLHAVMTQPKSKPTSLGVIFAYLIAGAVHVTSVVVLACGIWLAIAGWGNFFFMAAALLCLIVAWVTRPRIGKMPKNTVSRAEFPTLYRIVDEVSEKMGAKRVDGITIDFAYNAAFGSYGLSRKNVIHLGVPLISVLKPEEFVALLAHELGHGVNGDSTRGVFVGTAIRTLLEWQYFIKPDQILERNGSLVELAMVPVNLLLLLLSKGIEGIVFVLAHLLWQNKQRAEYLADALAAQVGGLQAKLSLLEKLHLEHIFAFAMQRILTGGATGSAAEEIRSQFGQIPASEIERVRRLEQSADVRLDSTHPPTAYRIQYLRSRGDTAPAYQISTEDQMLLDKEWRQLEEKTETRFIRYYRDHSYLLY